MRLPSTTASAFGLALTACGARTELLDPDGSASSDAAHAPRTIAIAMANRHACALRDDGAVYCWGANFRGQIATGDTVNQASPRLVQGIPFAVQIVAGGVHVCAVAADGALWCWGGNDHGQCGNNVSQFSTTPIRSAFDRGVVAAAAGIAQTWIRDGSGGLWSFGYNADCELCRPMPASDPMPRIVDSLTDAAELFGGSRLMCTHRNAGTFACCGNVGRVSPTWCSPSDPFASTPAIREPIRFAIGAAFACVQPLDGQVYCHGENSVGQLGNGTRVDDQGWSVSSLPAGIRVIAAGDQHACAASPTQIWCWGDDSAGQLGDRDLGDTTRPAVLRTTLHVQQLALGALASCALTDASEVWCWGANGEGALGDGTMTDSRTPVQVRFP